MNQQLDLSMSWLSTLSVTLPTEDQQRLLDLIDILIRDAKARTAYGT